MKHYDRLIAEGIYQSQSTNLIRFKSERYDWNNIHVELYLLYCTRYYIVRQQISADIEQCIISTRMHNGLVLAYSRGHAVIFA